jgi:hypothetical protein
LDADVREAEKRWRATRSVEDLVALFRHRVRVRPRLRERVRLAAFAGDEAARLILGPDAPVPPELLELWASELERLFGREGSVRVAHAIATAALPVWEQRPPVFAHHGHPASPGEQVAALEAWLACPCDRHRELAARMLSTDPHYDRMCAVHDSAGFALAHDAIAAAVQNLTEGGHLVDAYQWTAEALAITRRLRAGALPFHGDLEAGLPLMRDAIRLALVEWAVGP